MKSLFNLCLVAVLAIFSSCQSFNSEVDVVQCEENSNALVGKDKDEHGCLASAGYTWSELKNDCIRLFETGLKMNSVEDQDSAFAAFLVFSNDSTQVELFMPNISNHPVLPREGNRNEWMESNYSDDNNTGYRISTSDTGFVILHNNKVIFAQDTATLPINSVD